MIKHLYSHFTRYLLLPVALLVIGCNENAPAEQAETAAPETEASAASDTSPAATTEQAAEEADAYSDIMLGNPDAPIKVIEYASLTCSHCAKFHEDVFHDFKKNYLDTGRASYVLRHFVLNGPDLAASMIARCVDDKRYYAFVNLFLSRQASWIPPWQNVEPGEDKSLADLAAEAKMADFLRPTGVSDTKIRACLDTGKLRDDLLRVRAEGNAEYTITGTPTIIINGEKYEGPHTYEAFEQALKRYE